MAQRYNMDLVNAGRALLGQFGLAPIGATPSALAYLEQVRHYHPETYDHLTSAAAAAAEPGRLYRDLTFDESTALRDGVMTPSCVGCD